MSSRKKIRTLQYVEQLQNGNVTPKCYRSAIRMGRVFDLKLSKHSKIEEFHSTGITTLHIERCEERYLLSGSKNGDIAIHELLESSNTASCTAPVVFKFESSSMYGHTDCVRTVQWYPFDSNFFLSSGMDKTLRIWDVNSLKPKENIFMGHKIYCHHMSTICSKHNPIAVAMKCRRVIIIDPRTGAQCNELCGHTSSVISVRWSPLSEWVVASGGIDQQIFLWDIRQPKTIAQVFDENNSEATGSTEDLKTAHNKLINSLRFTKDGLNLVSLGGDGSLKQWDVSLGIKNSVHFDALPGKYGRLSRGMDMCCDSSNPVLFVPCVNKIHVYDLSSGCRIKTLIGHNILASACVFRPHTQELYSCGYDNQILVWSPGTDEE